MNAETGSAAGSQPQGQGSSQRDPKYLTEAHGVGYWVRNVNLERPSVAPQKLLPRLFTSILLLPAGEALDALPRAYMPSWEGSIPLYEPPEKRKVPAYSLHYFQKALFSLYSLRSWVTFQIGYVREASY